MQRFPRIITDMNALESEFLENETTPGDKFPAYFDEDDNPECIDHQMSKQIDLYPGQRCLKPLQNFLNFYF